MCISYSNTVENFLFDYSINLKYHKYQFVQVQALRLKQVLYWYSKKTPYELLMIFIIHYKRNFYLNLWWNFKFKVHKNNVNWELQFAVLREHTSVSLQGDVEFVDVPALYGDPSSSAPTPLYRAVLVSFTPSGGQQTVSNYLLTHDPDTPSRSTTYQVQGSIVQLSVICSYSYHCQCHCQ